MMNKLKKKRIKWKNIYIRTKKKKKRIGNIYNTTFKNKILFYIYINIKT